MFPLHDEVMRRQLIHEHTETLARDYRRPHTAPRPDGEPPTRRTAALMALVGRRRRRLLLEGAPAWRAHR